MAEQQKPKYKINDVLKVNEQAEIDFNLRDFVNKTGKVIDFNLRNDKNINRVTYFYCLIFNNEDEAWFEENMLTETIAEEINKLGDTKRNNNQSLKILLCLMLLIDHPELPIDLFKDILNDTEWYYIKKVLKRLGKLEDKNHIDNESLQKLLDEKKKEAEKNNYWNGDDEDDESYFG